MPKTHKHLEEQVERLAALGDPVRRSLYFHLMGRGGEVSREQAARALRISRALAAFHLDKLVDAGLLEVTYRRLSGRTGPGAGRPSKLYRKTARQIEVTLPARRYELAARLLAGAMSEAGPEAASALKRTAEAWGRELGSRVRERAGPRPNRERLLRGAIEELGAMGFEPGKDPAGNVVLGNCPFDALRSEACATICGMNLSMCEGMVEGLRASDWKAKLEPRPDRCCVVLQTA